MTRLGTLLLATVITTAAIAATTAAFANPFAEDAPAVAASSPSPPPGERASAAELRAIAARFDDQPFAGGQVQPRVAKAMTADTFVFLQFDQANAQVANRLDYLGIAVRGRFCAEVQPDAAKGSFSHFHRWIAPAYGAGHGTIPASEGYWMSWMSLKADAPGIGYGLFATPPSPCGGASALLPQAAPALDPASASEASAIEFLFDDQPFVGGQSPPVVSKWINENVFLFVEPSTAGAWAHVGIGVRGLFCEESQPTPDFTRFQRYEASSWASGAGGDLGDGGYWLARLGTGAGSEGVGIDRAFDPTPPGSCDGDGDQPAGSVHRVEVGDYEFRDASTGAPATFATVGDVVEFELVEGVHTATGGLASGLVAGGGPRSPILSDPGETYRFSVARPGTIPYTCELHAEMNGVITASA